MNEILTDYQGIVEKLARDGNHVNAIKSIDEMLASFDSLNEVEKYNLLMLKSNCLIQKKEFARAFEILEEIDPGDEDVGIAALKMKCIGVDETCQKAFEISKHIMENPSIDWEDNVDFLLEASNTFLALQSLNHEHTWDECNYVLDNFLYPAMQKDSKNTKVLMEIADMLSIKATAKEGISEEEQDRILDDSFNYLKAAETTLVDFNGAKYDDEDFNHAQCVHAIQRAEVEDGRKNSNKDEVVEWNTLALEYIKKNIKSESGNDTCWFMKSQLELKLEQEENAFYSSITGFCLYDPNSVKDSMFKYYEDHANNFEDLKRRSQLHEILEKKKQLISESQKMQNEEEDVGETWLSQQREPALSDLQKEVIAYRKKREEEDPTPQEFHICDVLGIRFQYSLWRDFKCPATHGCGFEYKVEVEDEPHK